MKTRQSSLTPAGLSVVLALVWNPAGAQDIATTTTIAPDLEASAAMTTDVVVGPVITNLVTSSSSAVAIKGIVSGRPESVSFSGQAQVTSRLVQDPDFGRPVLLLTIDLGSVTGVGSNTRTKYVTAVQEAVQRHLAPSHRVEVTFPFMKSGSTDMTSARTGVASFAFDIDVNTGAVTRAAGNVSSPAF